MKKVGTRIPPVLNWLIPTWLDSSLGCHYQNAITAIAMTQLTTAYSGGFYAIWGSDRWGFPDELYDIPTHCTFAI